MSLDRWVEELRHAARTNPETLTAALVRIDPSYGTGAERQAQAWDGHDWKPAPLAGIDLFRGQMDGDAEEEAVVQVRSNAESFGAGERDEATGSAPSTVAAARGCSRAPSVRS